MSYDALRSNVAQLAQMSARGFAPPKLGIVSSFDGRPGRYAVKVRLQPEDVETGWLPIILLLAGQAWGVYAAPSVGDQALVVYQEGDVATGLCLGFLPSDEDPPPEVESGEIHLIAKDGEASIVLKPDGSITSKGTWTHEGPFHATEDITSDADVIDQAGVALSETVESYNAHHHGGVQTGGGVSGTTDNPAT